MEKKPGIDTDSIGLRNVGLLVSVFGPPFDGCLLCSEIRGRIRVGRGYVPYRLHASGYARSKAALVWRSLLQRFSTLPIAACLL